MNKTVNPKKSNQRKVRFFFPILAKSEKYIHFWYVIKDSTLLHENRDSKEDSCTLGSWHYLMIGRLLSLLHLTHLIY